MFNLYFIIILLVSSYIYHFKMSNNIAQYLSTFQSHVPSLCIPKVFGNITAERICDNLNALNLGCIERIEMYPMVSKGEKYKKVVIHLLWSQAKHACKERYNMLTGKDFKIIYEKQFIYEKPGYWTVCMNKNIGNNQPIAPLLSIYEHEHDHKRLIRNNLSQKDEPYISEYLKKEELKSQKNNEDIHINEEIQRIENKSDQKKFTIDNFCKEMERLSYEYEERRKDIEYNERRIKLVEYQPKEFYNASEELLYYKNINKQRQKKEKLEQKEREKLKNK